jgi:uncharacterized membrane protein
MALRTHEMHPMLVHFPLTLIPAALAFDAVGRFTGSQSLLDVGRTLMPLAAASAVITGVAGFVAQGSVRAEAHAHDLLATHRNLNTVLVGVTSAMAIARQRVRQPGWAYFATGLTGLLAMGYTAYLGGKMVYAHGVGVEPHGVDLDQSPEWRRGSISAATRQSVKHITQQLRASVREVSQGEFAPAVRTHAHRVMHPEQATTPPP